MIDKKNLIPVQIAGFGRFVPESVVTNNDLAKIVETTDEWITTRTGIKERHVVSGNETNVSLGVKAAQQALDYAGMKAEEIDLIIAATSLPDNLYPSTACEIQGELGATKAAAFDLVAACSGLIYAMNVARNFIMTGTYENVLVIGTDVHSRFTNWRDRATCVLFGDGAGALILKKSEDGENDILAIDIQADGARGKELVLALPGTNCPLVEPNTARSPYVEMNGKEIYKFAVTTMPPSIQKCLESADMTIEDVDYLVPHQANIRIIEAIKDRLGLEEDQVIANVHKYGNTSAASVPIALSEAVEEGKVKLPCTAVLCGFGAGLTWGTAIVKIRERKNK